MPDPVQVAGEIVMPSERVRFLGREVRSDLKLSDHVGSLCAAVWRAAGWIRFKGRHLGRAELRILYHSWIGGCLHLNAAAYMPSMTDGDVRELQKACNAGVRAVLGLPRKGKDLEQGRKSVKIPTISQVREWYALVEAWEERAKMKKLVAMGRLMRRRETGQIRVLDRRGHRKRQVEVRAASAWNRLPEWIQSKLCSQRN